MAEQQEASRGPVGGGDRERKVETTHTGAADPNRAADMMKEKDAQTGQATNSGGFSASEGADTDGAGTGGMVEGKDAGGGSTGVGGSSGSSG